MSADLIKFLTARYSPKDEVTGKSADFTHTSLSMSAKDFPKGCFTISKEDTPELHRLVAESVFKHKKPVYLSERPTPVKSMTIDIDLKYPLDYSNRQHNERHIAELLKLYSEGIRTYVDMPADKPITAYVFQRNNPYAEKGNMKDGIHIMYPEICIQTEIQRLIRSHVLKNIDRFIANPEIGTLPVKNDRDEIIDLSVIDRNNWLMYGCSKPGKLPYLVEGVYRLLDDGSFEKTRPRLETMDDHIKMTSFLSVPNYKQDNVFQIKEEFAELLTEVKKPTAPRKRALNSTVAAKQLKATIEDEGKKTLLDDARKLVKLLAQWRAEDYNSWLEVGFCLYNISPALKDAWIEFSKRSDKYEEGACDRWHTFEKRDLNIGSLHRWARIDDPDPKKSNYNKVRSEMLQCVIFQSLSGTTQDVAKVVYEMFKHQYVCVDGKGKKWAEYVNHGWKIVNEGLSLKKKLGIEVLNEYLSLIASCHMMTQATEDEDKRESYQQRAKSLTDVSYKLRDITFKDKLMKEAIILFNDPTFESCLDTNPNLIGMSNGVYDLTTGTFRDGRPEDRLSLSTGIDYPDINPDDIDIEREECDNEKVQSIFEFMSQVFPIPAVRRYFYISLASYLKGLNSDEKFHVWTGVGGNGKSKVLELFEAAMGDYCFKLPITMLTQKRAQSGQATPELSLAGNKRFGSFQEPDEGASINVGLLKELTGNDKLYRRGLFSEAQVMRPMFSLALLCNHKPKLPADDEGTWRRFVIIDFISKFVDPERATGAPNEFPKNTSLPQEFPSWAPYFFVILTKYYELYKREGLRQPQEIKDATNSYRKECDAYAMFLDSSLEECSKTEAVLRLDEAYAVFKEWFSCEFNEKPPNRSSFKTYMDKKLRQNYNKAGGKTGWEGWRLKRDEEQHDGTDE